MAWAALGGPRVGMGLCCRAPPDSRGSGPGRYNWLTLLITEVNSCCSASWSQYLRAGLPATLRHLPPRDSRWGSAGLFSLLLQQRPRTSCSPSFLSPCLIANAAGVGGFQAGGREDIAITGQERGWGTLQPPPPKPTSFCHGLSAIITPTASHDTSLQALHSKRP